MCSSFRAPQHYDSVMTAPPSPRVPGGATPDRHATLVDWLGTRICGEFPPGTLLVVEELCERHAVSRSVVREALRVLASKGLVAARRGVGTTTQPPAAWNLFDPDVVRWRLRSPDRINQLRELLELRSGFEPEAAALAAERADPDAVADLMAAAARLWSLGHRDAPADFLDADEEFHRVLLSASGNDMFGQLAPVVGAILRGRAEEGLTPAHPAGRALENHMALARAIQRGDAERARAVALQLVSDTMDESRALWQRPGDAVAQA